MAAEKIFCTSCGAANVAEASFCTTCGSPISIPGIPSTPETMAAAQPDLSGEIHCTNCGAKNVAAASFCTPAGRPSRSQLPQRPNRSRNRNPRPRRSRRPNRSRRSRRPKLLRPRSSPGRPSRKKVQRRRLPEKRNHSVRRRRRPLRANLLSKRDPKHLSGSWSAAGSSPWLFVP